MIVASAPPILGFALGGPEMVVIFILVLLLFGAKKLPELARGMGKSMGEFRKAKEEFEHEITRAQDEAEKEWEEDTKKSEPEEETAEASKPEERESDSAPKEA